MWAMVKTKSSPTLDENTKTHEHGHDYRGDDQNLMVLKNEAVSGRQRVGSFLS